MSNAEPMTSEEVWERVELEQQYAQRRAQASSLAQASLNAEYLLAEQAMITRWEGQRAQAQREAQQSQMITISNPQELDTYLAEQKGLAYSKLQSEEVWTRISFEQEMAKNRAILSQTPRMIAPNQRSGPLSDVYLDMSIEQYESQERRSFESQLESQMVWAKLGIEQQAAKFRTETLAQLTATQTVTSPSVSPIRTPSPADLRRSDYRVAEMVAPIIADVKRSGGLRLSESIFAYGQSQRDPLSMLGYSGSRRAMLERIAGFVGGAESAVETVFPYPKQRTLPWNWNTAWGRMSFEVPIVALSAAAISDVVAEKIGARALRASVLEGKTPGYLGRWALRSVPQHLAYGEVALGDIGVESYGAWEMTAAPRMGGVMISKGVAQETARELPTFLGVGQSLVSVSEAEAAGESLAGFKKTPVERWAERATIESELRSPLGRYIPNVGGFNAGLRFRSLDLPLSFERGLTPFVSQSLVTRMGVYPYYAVRGVSTFGGAFSDVSLSVLTGLAFGATKLPKPTVSVTTPALQSKLVNIPRIKPFQSDVNIERILPGLRPEIAFPKSKQGKRVLVGVSVLTPNVQGTVQIPKSRAVSDVFQEPKLLQRFGTTKRRSMAKPDIQDFAVVLRRQGKPTWKSRFAPDFEISEREDIIPVGKVEPKLIPKQASKQEPKVIVQLLNPTPTALKQQRGVPGIPPFRLPDLSGSRNRKQRKLWSDAWRFKVHPVATVAQNLRIQLGIGKKRGKRKKKR